MLRHEQQTVRMVLATVEDHSYGTDHSHQDQGGGALRTSTTRQGDRSSLLPSVPSALDANRHRANRPGRLPQEHISECIMEHAEDAPVPPAMEGIVEFDFMAPSGGQANMRRRLLPSLMQRRLQ